jgi:hypothetical protein
MDVRPSCTDGVRPDWFPSRYPEVFQRHPALIAVLLFRDCWRPSDDVLVVVVDVSPITQAALSSLSQ